MSTYYCLSIEITMVLKWLLTVSNMNYMYAFDQALNTNLKK